MSCDVSYPMMPCFPPSSTGEEGVEVFLCHAEGSGALLAEGKHVNYISQQPFCLATQSLFLTVCVPDRIHIRSDEHLGRTSGSDERNKHRHDLFSIFGEVASSEPWASK